MFGPLYVPFWTAITALAAVGQVVLLALSAYFVYRYLQETKKLRISAQQQADAAFKPAIVARCLGSMDNPPTQRNVGTGPALEVEWSLLNSKLGDKIPLLEPHAQPFTLGMDGVKPLFEVSGSSGTAMLECRYRSLSGRRYLSRNAYNINTGQFSTILVEQEE
jgi:hypothetical protein